MGKKTKHKDRFKQMCRVNKELLHYHAAPLPFARPGSWAGTSTTPASEAGMQPASSNPFAWPNSRVGFAPPKPTSSHSSSLSPMSGLLFQEDVNMSVSWDLVETDTDMEVANINSPSTHQTVTNKNCADSSNESQNKTVSLNHQLKTLYNQDFFVADTMGRRLSQITDKSSYLSLLPNGNAALQLRLPDMLIYLKMDTYLIDVKSGHHYAMCHNRIEKMSVMLKLYAPWPYSQLLQTIHDDAVHFGVNSPKPTTSGRSHRLFSICHPLKMLNWLSKNSSHHHASLQLSNMNRRVSAYKCQSRCLQEQKGNKFCKIMW